MKFLEFTHAVLQETKVCVPFPNSIFYVYEDLKSPQPGTRIVSNQGAVIAVKESVEEVKQKLGDVK